MLASTRNARALERAVVPRLALEDFRRAILDGVARQQRVAALFGVPESGGGVELVVVLADDARATLHVGTTVVEGDVYPSLTPECPQVHLFEREIAEQWGLVPRGHPWLEPVRFTASRRPGHDAWNRPGDRPPAVGPEFGETAVTVGAPVAAQALVGARSSSMASTTCAAAATRPLTDERARLRLARYVIIRSPRIRCSGATRGDGCRDGAIPSLPPGGCRCDGCAERYRIAD